MTKKDADPPKARPMFDLMLAVVGAVAGAVITGALANSASPTTKLFGAAVGASIVPFVAAVGPRRHLRAAMAVLIAAGALGLTYLGGLTGGKAAGVETPVFPPPPGVTIFGPNTPSSSAPAPTSKAEGKLGIEVTPQALTCKPECEKITIKSTGTDVLKITAIELDGTAQARFKHSGDCAPKQLKPQETCVVDVSFNRAGASGNQQARLVIHQNLPGDPTFIDLTGEAPLAKLDLAASATNMNCNYQPSGVVDGRDAIQVFFRLTLAGGTLKDLPGLVPVRATSTSGASTSFNTAVSQGPQAGVVAALPLSAKDYGQAHTITIIVDPDGKIAETNEGNNQLRVTLTLPAKPNPAKTLVLSCAGSNT